MSLVFISYAREDLVWARKCSALFGAVGVNTFLDERSIQVGDQWPQVLVDNIQRADRMILGWSEDAAHSLWVQKEWRMALELRRQGRERFLIIDRLDDTQLPPELQNIQTLHGVFGVRQVEVEVEVSIRKKYEMFQASDEEVLRYALAAFLGTSPNGITVLRKTPGSVRLTLRLESAAGHRLESDYNGRNPLTVNFFEALQIESLVFRWTDGKAPAVSMVAPAQSSSRCADSLELEGVFSRGPSVSPTLSQAQESDSEFYIAHAHGDRLEYAQRLAHDLRLAGYRVFFEEFVPQLPERQLEVDSALQTARVILVVVPADESRMNSYLRAEIGRATTMHALDAKGHLIIPLLPQPASCFREGSLPFGLLNFHSIDTSRKDTPAVVRELIEILLRQPSSLDGRASVCSTQDDAPGAGPTPAPATIEITLSRPQAKLQQQELAALALLLGIETTRLELSEVGRNTTVVSVELNPVELPHLERLLSANRGDAAASGSFGEQSICHIRRAVKNEPWRVIYDGSGRAQSQFPPAAAQAERRAPQITLTNVLKVSDPWSLIALRNKLDGCLNEHEVISALSRELRSLPDVLMATLYVVRAIEGPLVRYPQEMEKDELSENSFQVELKDCLLTQRPQSRNCGVQLHHFVPLVDLHVAVGVVHIVLGRPESPTVDFCNQLASELASAIHRIRRQEAYYHISRSAADALIVQQQLDSMLDEIIALGFSYAAVSVADRFAGDIEMVQAKNVPTAWMIRAKHQLDDADIIPDVYRSQKATGVMSDWDPRLDVEIYERFEHRNLARIFAPLLVDGHCVGVIEYGCPTVAKERVFAEENIHRVNQVLANHLRPEFVLARPGVLIERVARYAMDALSADASTIYIFERLQDLNVSLNTPALMAGAGVDPRFLHDVAPRKDGLGHRAMRSGEILAWQENNLRDQHPKLWVRGVKTLVAIPLLRDHQPAELSSRCGVLYLEYRAAPRKLTAAERGVAAVFARHAEIMIGNMILAERAKTRNEEELRNARLLDIVRALPGPSLSHVLSEVARNVLQLLDADNVVLYEYLQKEDTFLPPTINGYFLERDAMDQQPSDDVARSILKHGHRFYSAADSEAFLVAVREKQTRFVVRENIKSCAMLALKDGGETVGVMFVNHRHERVFSRTKRLELETLADSVGMAIRRSRELRKSEERRQKELEALQAVEVSLTSVDLDTMSKVLQLIVERGTEVVGASAGIIMLLDSEGFFLKSAATHGFPQLALPVMQSTGMGVVGKAFIEKKPQLVRDVREGDWPSIYVPTVSNTISELAVPILRDGGARGVINFEATRPGAFDELDCAFVDSLCRQVSLVMACLERFREPIAQERLITLVRERVAQESDSRIAASVVLTSVTAGQGLGFSRAMLFVRQSQKMLIRLTVGPLRRGEAEEAWASHEARSAASRIPQATGEPASVQAERVLHMLITRASENLRDSTRGAEPLEEWLKTCGPIDVHQSICLVARCVRQGKPIVVSDREQDEIRDLLQRAADDSVASQLIAVPILVDGSVEGVLLVDSEFLPATQQPMWRAIQRTGSAEVLLDTLVSLAQLIRM